MSRLFGTDGVRGVANKDLTPDLALALGRAAGRVLAPSGGQVVVGRDTRVSGPMLEARPRRRALSRAGVDVRWRGIVPTPAVAFLTVDEKAQRRRHGDLGVAQSGPRQRDQVLLGRGLRRSPKSIEDEIEALDVRAADRSAVGDCEVGAATDFDEPVPIATSSTSCARSHVPLEGSPGRARLRVRRRLEVAPWRLQGGGCRRHRDQ